MKKEIHLAHAATVVAAFLICVPMRLIADPTFDASSATAFVSSAKKVLSYAQQDPNMGQQDKTIFSLQLSSILIKENQAAIDQAGPNGTQNQIDALFVEHVKKYNGMTATQLVAKLRADVAAENAKAESEAKAKAEQAAKEKTQEQSQKDAASAQSKQRQEVIIKNWLEGKDTPVGFPDATLFFWSLSKDNHDSYTLWVKLNKANILEAELNNTLSGFTQTEQTFKLRGGIIPYDNVRLDSIEQTNWYIPKFKEWTNKLLALPPEERPPLLIKEIQQKSFIGPTIWFAYEKDLGPGVLVFDRQHYGSYGSNVNAAMKSALQQLNELFKTGDPNLKRFFLPDCPEAISYGVKWFDINKIKLASDLPSVLSEAFKEIGGKVKEAQAKAGEDAEKQRNAVKKLNLD